MIIWDESTFISFLPSSAAPIWGASCHVISQQWPRKSQVYYPLKCFLPSCVYAGSLVIPESLVIYQFSLAFQHVKASIAANCLSCPYLSSLGHHTNAFQFPTDHTQAEKLSLWERPYLSKPHCTWHWEECLRNWSISSGILQFPHVFLKGSTALCPHSRFSFNEDFIKGFSHPTWPSSLLPTFL